LVKALAGGDETEYALSYEGEDYSGEDNNNLFHIINDQNGRNIIQGETQDFIIGSNIRKEYLLKASIDEGFSREFERFNAKLKGTFGIKKKEFSLKSSINNKEVSEYISDLANSKSKGKGIDKTQFCEILSSLPKTEPPEYDDKKLNFLISDLNNKTSLIKVIKTLTDIEKTDSLQKIEENTDAIKLLKKYEEMPECIVCDHEINQETLLDKKIDSKSERIKALNDATKAISNVISNTTEENDPFGIKKTSLSALKNGDINEILILQEEFNNYTEIHEALIYELFKEFLTQKQLIEDLKEYTKLTQEDPKLTDEDVLLIKTFINETIEKEIRLDRTEDNTILLTLSGKEILNQGRDDLHLSNGEQNFISIIFELLKAKNSDKEIIILDDPISSFDSIFKNKIAFSIIKFLEKKKQIIFTHNTDLIQLLEHQYQGCFTLYQLNNKDGEENGLIPITKKEQKLLIYLTKLVDFFRKDVSPELVNEKEFLISVIPFMRGYASLIGDKESKKKLTSLMHGYNNETHDVSQLYTTLFKPTFTLNTLPISAQNIISTSAPCEEIIDTNSYPLLNRTLRHLLTYLKLRLSVEKKLVDKFDDIDPTIHKMLTQIITQAFGGNSESDKAARIFLLSRKTLLNEFNHFDTNMSIFQPAIDITETMLEKEKNDIEVFLKKL